MIGFVGQSAAPADDAKTAANIVATTYLINTAPLPVSPSTRYPPMLGHAARRRDALSCARARATIRVFGPARKTMHARVNACDARRAGAAAPATIRMRGRK
ncbi:MAG: hypothetical protein IT537_21255 [Hyphomicrobiales bacterium]|nr:hypothetical protein [Hyphomicrobiales bacterium]